MNIGELLAELAQSPADDREAAIDALPPEMKKELSEGVFNVVKEQKWLPNTGPQSDAYFSKADILLYGGSGGAGKSDLGLGLAFNEHERSLILRRKYVNLSGLTERAIKINGTRDGFNGGAPPLLRSQNGKYIQFAGSQHLGDEEDWQGIPFDLKIFDETVQFLESQVRFHLGWVRSTTPGQRQRVLMPTNPPIDASGDWIIGFFRPWLDLTHPNPAKHGELRWFATAPDGIDVEVEGPEPIQFPGAKNPTQPKSRSFIPGMLSDNPYLVDSGYQATLDSLPEPLRSAVRDGNFMASRADDAMQIIPMAWIIEAQDRWKPDGWKNLEMTACALDMGAGGDETVLTFRHGGWFGPQDGLTGDDARDESHAMSMVIRRRKDHCPIAVDVGGGWGGSTTLLFKENGIDFSPFNGGARAPGKTRDGHLGFVNKRAWAYWTMREELDPNQEGGSPIALPPDPQLRADLAAVRWKSTTRGIQVEAKDDIIKRVGRSPNRGDSAVMCLAEGARAALKRMATRMLGGRTPKVIKMERGRR